MTARSVRAKAAGMQKDEAIETPAAVASAKTGGLMDTARFLLFLFAFTLLLRSFIVAPFNIPSGSMLPRMMIGDYLFVSKWPYGFSRYSFPFGILSFKGRILQADPRRGDVVVFRYPGNDSDWVKRVIGMPGDMIQVRDGTVYLNGDAIPKTRIADYRMPVTPNSPCRSTTGADREVIGSDGKAVCVYPRYRETLPGGRTYEVLDQGIGPNDNTGVFLVPEGHYFMMGDNRDDSEDSRVSRENGGIGMLPRDYVIGRAMITFFSTDGSAAWLKPWTWFTAARWDRIGGTY